MKERGITVEDLVVTNNKTFYEVKLGKTKYLPDGSEIEVAIDNPMNLAKASSDTSKHESLHAGTAPHKVKLVSIVPGPGYAGITEFTQFDAPAAAAPHRRGMSGTSWDEYILIANGHNPDSAGAAADARLSGKDKHIDVLSRRLEAEKTLTGAKVVETMERVENGENVVIKLKDRDGNISKQKESGIKGETVIVAFPDVELPQAA